MTGYPLDAARPLGALRLDGRAAVITGAASGIGRGIAQMFAAVGARLIISDRDEAGLARLVAELGPTTRPFVAALGDRQVSEDLAAFADGFGPIDIWVNAAGTASLGTVAEGSEALYDRILGVNQDAVYWGCSAAARRMERQGRGSIINISSVAADKAQKGLAVYTMSKAAVNGLTRVLAEELAPAGVRVNAIAPGFVITNLTVPEDLPEDERERMIAESVKRAPLGIAGYPEDIAHAALYLAADASRYVTGQVLRVNGGSTMPL